MEHRQRTTTADQKGIAEPRPSIADVLVRATAVSSGRCTGVVIARWTRQLAFALSRTSTQLHPTSAHIHICIAASTHIWTGASDIYTDVYAYIANCILRQPIATPCLTCQRTRQKHPRFNRCSALAAAIFTCSTPFHPSPASTARPRLVDTCHIIASEPCHFVHRGHKRYRK